MPDGAGRFTQGFSGPALLRIPLPRRIASPTGLSPAAAGLPRPFDSPCALDVVVLQPRTAREPPGLGCSAFARHYLRNHYCFLFLGLLRCFSSARSPPAHAGSGGCPIRRPVDLRLCAAPHGLSQLYASFIASRCQGIRRAPFVTWSSLTTLAPGRRAGRLDEATPYTGYSLTFLLFRLLSLPQTARAARGASPRRGGGLPTEIPSRQRTAPCAHAPGHRGATGIRTPDPLLAKQVL